MVRSLASTLKMQVLLAAVLLASESLRVQQVLGARTNAVFRPMIPALIIVGDSTVDVGNNNGLATIIKSNFGPYGRIFSQGPTGRFCDGKIIPDYVAEFLGLPYPLPYLDPKAKGSAILTGINTASSASGYYEMTAKNFNVIPLSEQFEWIKEWKQQVTAQVGTEKANKIFTEAVWIVSTGSNDYVNNYFINLPLQGKYNVEEYTTMLVGFTVDSILKLYSLGARRLAVVGLPPLGCLPSQIRLRLGKDKCIDSLNEVANNYNKQVAAAVDKIRPSMPGGIVALLDAYSYIYDAVQNPANYGVHKTVDACCGTGTLEVAILCNEASLGTCPNADEYLFWDSFHPTSKFNAGLAKAFYETATKEFGLA